jgi:hypothetical protein
VIVRLELVSTIEYLAGVSLYVQQIVNLLFGGQDLGLQKHNSAYRVTVPIEQSRGHCTYRLEKKI